MKIVGLDPSLTATGVAVSEEGYIDTYTLIPPRTLRGGARLDWIGNQLVVATDGASLVATEGYAFNARGRGVHLGRTWRRAPAHVVSPRHAPAVCRAASVGQKVRNRPR